MTHDKVSRIAAARERVVEKRKALDDDTASCLDAFRWIHECSASALRSAR